MLEERGVVTSVDEQFITVKTQRNNSCGGCSANKSCGTGSLANILGKKHTEIKVTFSNNVKVGDTVIIGLNEKYLVKSAMILYLLPIFTMFIMAGSYKYLSFTMDWQQSELFTALFGIAGLLFGLVIVRLITVKMSKNYQPIIHKTIKG